MLTTDDAVCIRAIDYSETSQIATFFTRNTGKIGAIAKGSKRPKSAFDGPIEIFAHGRLVFSGSNRQTLATLTEFQQQPGLSNLPKDLFVLNCCLFGAELVNLLTGDYDPHPGLFDKFFEFLQNADRLRPSADLHRDILALLIHFQLDLLRQTGLSPVLNACVNCKTSLAANWPRCYFSSAANGLVCRDCEAALPDRIELSKAVTNSLCSPEHLAGSSKKTLDEAEKLLVQYFTHILNRPPKMAKYISKS